MLTYDLPKELIAQHPVEPRDAARLLVLDRESGKITHRIFKDLPGSLRPGDCLVLNDTRVNPARLLGRKADTGGKVELLVLGEREGVYRCLGQPGRRLKPGAKLLFDHGSLQAEVLSWEAGERVVRFSGEASGKVLEQLGQIPLPPYIGRPVEPRDAQWYQTVFARHPGAVAAPTAGLHFTGELLDRIRRRGVQVLFLTLHVGWGTFKPVAEKELAEGRLHPEEFRVPPETLEAIRAAKARGGRVVAVGTTVVRALESKTKGKTTDLFIRPGFPFQVVDALITNFHLPGTSLLYLVAAFAGEERVLAAYEEAIREKYRFYSYGEAMLIQ
ncbi:MAG: tRNA preQ1(34) S-adenosylmethionine ribosyltransferase-isomerase QueA [Candidatus Omnitrophica bacterium]|nr:tRNA preQ1(34) S-adenosylmethionine ribosyltransferase-isomerase QueA [Candidatus Omnitrophota bacterium]